jgi:hypothetical protein
VDGVYLLSLGVVSKIKQCPRGAKEPQRGGRQQGMIYEEHESTPETRGRKSEYRPNCWGLGVLISNRTGLLGGAKVCLWNSDLTGCPVFYLGHSRQFV